MTNDRRIAQARLYLTETGNAVLAATADCRLDMREPDQVGVGAYILGGRWVGKHPHKTIQTISHRGSSLDNAFGDAPDNSTEWRVVLTREGGKNTIVNLATLIALARVGAQSLTLGQNLNVRA